jgi:chaperonin GroEL (HSP60 family)
VSPETNPASHVKQVSASEVDERLAALVGNAAAVAAVASAVEGTLGPKGLNCMLVDRFGDVTITNDGSTILDKIDVSHPASRLLIQVARAQDREVGDGTTTATVLASALISAGVDRVRQGVPVTKVIEGVRAGVAIARETVQALAQPVADLHSPLVRRAALIAGREDEEIAALALDAAAAFPADKLLHDPAFRLADHVVAKEGARSQVVPGLIVDKEPLNRQMPRELHDVGVLLVDDALEPEPMEEEALGTEAGFQRYLQLQEEFKEEIQLLSMLGAGAVFVRKGVSEVAEEALTEAGILVVRRVLARDLAALAAHTGATVIKRSGLRKNSRDLRQCLGRAAHIVHDEKLEHIRVTGGAGEPAATILVGSATREVREERQRMAQDAAAAVQAALRGGVVPGGGATEIEAMRAVQARRHELSSMAAYGMDCVAEALKRPLAQIVANAGFNPLEKVEEVIARHNAPDGAAYAINCDTGELQDMVAAGVVDPTQVKLHALDAAAEIAEAILRISVIIRKKEGAAGPPADAQ